MYKIIKIDFLIKFFVTFHNQEHKMVFPFALSKQKLVELIDVTFETYTQAIESPEMLSEMDYRKDFSEFHAWTACVFNVVTLLLKKTDVFFNTPNSKISAKRWIYWLINEKDFYDGSKAWKSPKDILGAEYFETLSEHVTTVFNKAANGVAFTMKFVDAHRLNTNDTRKAEGNFVPVLKWIEVSNETLESVEVAPETDVSRVLSEPKPFMKALMESVKAQAEVLTSIEAKKTKTDSQSTITLLPSNKTTWADIVEEEIKAKTSGPGVSTPKVSDPGASPKHLKEPTPMQMASAMAFLHSLMGEKSMSHEKLNSAAEKLFRMGSTFVTSNI